MSHYYSLLCCNNFSQTVENNKIKISKTGCDDYVLFPNGYYNTPDHVSMSENQSARIFFNSSENKVYVAVYHIDNAAHVRMVCENINADRVNYNSSSFSYVHLFYPSAGPLVNLVLNSINNNSDFYNDGKAMRIFSKLIYENGYAGLYEDVPYSMTMVLTNESGDQSSDWNLDGSWLSVKEGGNAGNKAKITITSPAVGNITFKYHYVSCFANGTLISLADGTKKPIEELTYNDDLKVWNFDEGHEDSAKLLWISEKGRTVTSYWRCELSDGTVLKLIGPYGHRLFNYTNKQFEYPTDITPGDEIFTEHGLVKFVSCEKVDEVVECYNLITNRHINCYANETLTSCRYNRIYPFDDDMKFIKDGRKIRPYKEFRKAGISREWYVGLRLGEQTDSVQNIQKYIYDKAIISAPREQESNFFARIWSNIKIWWKSIFG